MAEWGSRWRRAEIEILVYDTQDGQPRAATAAKLGRTLLAVKRYATVHNINYPADKAEGAKLRERWMVILPSLREGLRRDILREMA